MSKKKTPRGKEPRKPAQPVDDATLYAEFVPSAYEWLPAEAQKERAKRLEKPVDGDSE
ncbi:MAG: hypothetical protein LBH54_01505 [Clostridiales bacterium]|jgi:hypothetical protein|nr:hypothetical protein [Clostridiales bacterium]